MCARRRSNFLLGRQEKVTKEKAAPSLRPFASLRATCDARSWGGVAELAAFFELRSNIRDEPDHEVRVSCGTRTHPSPLRFSAQPAGVGSGVKGGCCFAATPGVGYALRAADGLGAITLPRPSAARQLGPSEAMARVEPVPTPF